MDKDKSYELYYKKGKPSSGILLKSIGKIIIEERVINDTTLTIG